LGHPSGTFTFNIDIDTESLYVTKAGVARTARPIMDGIAYVKVGKY
ncbi:MAG: 3-methylitaconate isomerase, partial [Veillonella sp.]